MNSVFELWAGILPERAMACTFNLEYLLVGGRDGATTDRPYFMWYDWMVGGWGGRNGRDGYGATGPVFGVQLGTQPFEGQERLAPVLTTGHELLPDSGGPGSCRGGLGPRRAAAHAAERSVMSYCCDRERSVTWGLWGGLPSIPHGVWLNRGTRRRALPRLDLLGVPIKPGTSSPARPPAAAGWAIRCERDPRRRLRGRRRRLRHDRARPQGLRRGGDGDRRRPRRPTRSTRRPPRPRASASARARGLAGGRPRGGRGALPRR